MASPKRGANALLDKDLQPFEGGGEFDDHRPARSAENQFDALVILTFNIGAIIWPARRWRRW